ncbi:MAG TPA: hypothetical protein DER09_11935 [Prolixibacteraceae bacterium]|nr:hypothetical protein [Prolixibacteraceae bacterium]
MTKKLIGKYFTFKFVGRKYDISGVVLDYNDQWTFIRTCEDYSPNGFTIFKNEKVDYYFGDKERMATKILKLKEYSYKNDPKITLSSLDEILNSIDNKYGLIQLDTRKGDASDVVKYLGQVDSLYLFDELTTTAKWRYKLKLPEKECRFISFDNNYLNSLKLVTKFKDE